MLIDLSTEIVFPSAIGHKIRYRRIDNIPNPQWVTAGVFYAPFPVNPTPNGVPNGQYEIETTPVYPDGRACDPVTTTTPICPALISLNAVQQGTNLVITYVADTDVPQVRIVVNYPNGGVFDQTVTNGNNNSTVTVPLPVGIYGDYTVYGQSVCDSTTNFYSQQGNPVTVTVQAPAIPALNATITANNIGGTSSQVGKVGLSFVFNVATTQPITITAGYCNATWCYAMGVLGTTGPKPNNPYSVGNTGWSFTIPQGVTSYNTGELLTNSTDGSGPWAMDIYPTSNPNYAAGSIRNLYLKVGSPAGAITSAVLTNSDITLTMV